MSNSAAELAIYRQLQKAFKVIQQQTSTWDEILKTCNTDIGSLANLYEQIDCCKQVEVQHTALAEFPDVKEKLLYKLSASSAIVHERLQAKISLLDEVCSKLTHQSTTSMNVYNKYSDDLDIDTVTRRSPTKPSIADMLQWVQDIERMYREDLAYRRLLLNDSSIENGQYDLTKQWTTNPELKEMVQCVLAYVSFFQAETF